MIDRIRRDILAMGAAATAAAAAPSVFAQQAGPGGVTTGFYERGNVRIRYQEAGSGFPLLCTPGGGLNSRISNWQNAVINAMGEFRNDFRCITMDQRNANGGESSGPIPVDDPWGAFAEDQLGLMDHLGIRQFVFFGNCIGGSFALKLMEKAPGRVLAAVLSQPIGHRPEKPDVMYDSGRDVWAPEFRKTRPEVSMETIGKYLHALYRVRADFVYSVSRDFVRNCQTPMLVLPDDTDAHAYQTSVDIASLAPNADVSVYPWKDPPDLKARTIARARNFLKAHLPQTASR
jgi:pimeloyl-ACP methyl ester carboxylesterase